MKTPTILPETAITDALRRAIVATCRRQRISLQTLLKQYPYLAVPPNYGGGSGDTHD